MSGSRSRRKGREGSNFLLRKTKRDSLSRGGGAATPHETLKKKLREEELKPSLNRRSFSGSIRREGGRCFITDRREKSDRGGKSYALRHGGKEGETGNDESGSGDNREERKNIPSLHILITARRGGGEGSRLF